MKIKYVLAFFIVLSITLIPFKALQAKALSEAGFNDYVTELKKRGIGSRLYTSAY